MSINFNLNNCLTTAEILKNAFIRDFYLLLLEQLFDDVCCIPGGLLCPEAAAASEHFTFTVGLGDDLVMRLGVDSIENLRTDLLTAIRCCTLPKVRTEDFLASVSPSHACLFVYLFNSLLIFFIYLVFHLFI